MKKERNKKEQNDTVGNDILISNMVEEIVPPCRKVEKIMLLGRKFDLLWHVQFSKLFLASVQDGLYKYDCANYRKKFQRLKTQISGYPE